MFMNTFDKIKDTAKSSARSLALCIIVDVAAVKTDPDGRAHSSIAWFSHAEPTGIDANVLERGSMVRPSDGFPVFSFIAQNEIGKGILQVPLADRDSKGRPASLRAVRTYYALFHAARLR